MHKKQVRLTIAGKQVRLKEIEDSIKQWDEELAPFTFFPLASSGAKISFLVGLPDEVSVSIQRRKKISSALYEFLKARYHIRDDDVGEIGFIAAHELPCEPRGKIDMGRCKHMFEKGMLKLIDKTHLVPVEAEHPGGSEGPQNEVEETLLRILEEMIESVELDPIDEEDGRDASDSINEMDQITLTTSFAEGMDSLLITLFMAEVEEHFDIVIPLSNLYKEPTLRNLANEIISIKGWGHKMRKVPM